MPNRYQVPTLCSSADHQCQARRSLATPYQGRPWKPWKSFSMLLQRQPASLSTRQALSRSQGIDVSNATNCQTTTLELAGVPSSLSGQPLTDSSDLILAAYLTIIHLLTHSYSLTTPGCRIAELDVGDLRSLQTRSLHNCFDSLFIHSSRLASMRRCLGRFSPTC